MEGPDYPAAHSMDTDWFAIDLAGNVACFCSNESGPIPVGRVSTIDADREVQQFCLTQTEDPYYWEDFGLPGLADLGFFIYVHDSYDGGDDPTPPYQRKRTPQRAIRIDQLPPTIAEPLRRFAFPVVFADAEWVQPAEQFPCIPWEGRPESYLCADGHTVRPMPPPTDDPPAAHSMDTRWFAIDLDGNVASFYSGESGPVPVGRGYEHDPNDWSHFLRLLWLAKTGVALGEWDFLEEEALSRLGLFVYAHSSYDVPTPPYHRVSVPSRLLHREQLPPAFRESLTRYTFPVLFTDAEWVQPAEHFVCDTYGTESYLCADGHTVRPFSEDPPAAHSMDQQWFALDRDGNVVTGSGTFDTWGRKTTRTCHDAAHTIATRVKDGWVEKGDA